MVDWSTAASASNLSRFLGVKLICLARGAFGFTGGVTNWYIAPYQGTFSLFTDTHFLNIDTDTAVQRWIQKLMYRFLPRHVFSVRSADTDFLNTDTDTVVQKNIQKTDSLLRLKARFLCLLGWYRFPKYWYDSIVNTDTKNMIHCFVLRHVFSVRGADTHSLNQRHPLSTTQLLYTLQRRISTTGIQ